MPKDTYMNINFDGVGTKIEIAERMAKHDAVAYDLFAMVCDDAVVRGAEPVIVGSILDVKSLGDKDESYIKFLKQLAVGYVNAAKDANVAVVNGEVAELGARVNGYGKFNYNWGAGVVWFAKKDRLLTGHEIKSGDMVVALKEKVLRSNGLSLVRKIIKENYGEEWHNENYKGKSLGELVLEPSKIYSKAVVDMFGGFGDWPKAEIHGVVHVTGGGVPGKLGRILKPSKLSANLDNLFKPSELMLHCREISNVTDREAYKTWNMGQGMLIITPEPDKVMEVAEKYNIESKVAGIIIDNMEELIIIKNKGLNYKKDNMLLLFSY